MSHAALNAEPKPQILICDDDVDFSVELIEALRMRGFSATALLTISAVRAAILSPSVIILDMNMPKISGLDILRMLAEHPRRDRFKIVLASGDDEERLYTAASFCEREGLRLLGTFRKPVQVKPLCELLAAATA